MIEISMWDPHTFHVSIKYKESEKEKKTMRKAVNILWDVDDKEDLATLPDEIEIPEWIKDLDEISDYISNVTGFCHKGYQIYVDNGLEVSKKVGFEISDFVKLKETGEIILIIGKNGDMYTVKDIQDNESEVRGEDIEPTETIYKIPVTWEIYGEIKIRARSALEAMDKAVDSFDSIDLPDGKYVDASLTLSETDPELFCKYLHLYQ